MRASFLLLLLTLFAGPAAADKAKLLFNGRILVDASADAPNRIAGAALVQDGHFLSVGTLVTVDQVARDRQLWPDRIDLHGGFAVPALTDAHGHVEGLGQSLQRLRLVGTKSAEEIAKLVAERAKTTPAGEWILGRGWDQNDWAVEKFPTHDVLDRVAGDHPVWLRRVDGHAAWANAKAIELAGVTKDTPDPPGGRIEHAGDGSPTGVFIDNAMTLVESKQPQPTREQRKRSIVLALERCAELGLTAVHDAGIDTEEVSIYEELANEGKMPIRVFAMLSAADLVARTLPADKARSRRRKFAVRGQGRRRAHFARRGAARAVPDDAGNTGLLRTTPDTPELIARRCLETATRCACTRSGIAATACAGRAERAAKAGEKPVGSATGGFGSSTRRCCPPPTSPVSRTSA